VEEAFSAVGGAECSARAAAIVLKTRQLAQSEEGRDELTRVLRLEPSFNKLPLGESDFGHFFALVATPFQAAVHHNDVGTKN
jgi:hypothetical protein